MVAAIPAKARRSTRQRPARARETKSGMDFLRTKRLRTVQTQKGSRQRRARLDRGAGARVVRVTIVGVLEVKGGADPQASTAELTFEAVAVALGDPGATGSELVTVIRVVGDVARRLDEFLDGLRKFLDGHLGRVPDVHGIRLIALGEPPDAIDQVLDVAERARRRSV
jgi:hypothetical protein